MRLSLPMKLQSLVNSKDKWELTLMITQSLGTVQCFSIAFSRKKIRTSLLHKEGGGGGVFYIFLNGEAPSQCSNCIPFLNP